MPHTSAIDSALVTGLTIELAQEIADNSKQLLTRDVIQVAYGHIQSGILDTIFSIIQGVHDSVF